MDGLGGIRCRARSEKLLHREGIEFVRSLTELTRHFDRALLPQDVPHLIRTERAKQTRDPCLAASAGELDRRAFEHPQIPLPEALFEDRLQRRAHEFTRQLGVPLYFLALTPVLLLLAGYARWRQAYGR